MKSNTKILYVISLVNHSLLFERTLYLLNKEKYQLSVVLLHSEETELEINLKAASIPVYRIYYKTKKDLPRATGRMTKLLWKTKPDIIHTHLFEGSLIGAVSGWIAGIKRRIHTRHDATIHHDYFPSAVKYDKLTNLISTDIIAITQNVRNILIEKENVRSEKITVIHHGFDIEDFIMPSPEQSDSLIQKYPTIQGQPVVGVVSRFIEWKGVQYIIDAFIELRRTHPAAHLVLANAHGSYEKQIHTKLNTLPPESFTTIKFEKSAAALYSLFDVFVHTPVDEQAEAFGQVYIEAMAAGVPSVITRSGIACDYASDRENCLIVPHKNSSAIVKAITELLENKDLAAKIRNQARNVTAKEFTLESMITQIEKLYDR